MIKILPCLTISCLLVFKSWCQNGEYGIGARSAGMAFSSVTLEDEWALFNNVGALSYVESTAVFGSFKNLYGIPELTSLGFGFAQPLLNGTAGLGVFRFGGSALNEHRVNLGFSNRFGLVSLGANVSYFQLRIQDGLTRRTFMIDFGGHAKLSPQLIFGAHITNLNQAKTSEINDSRIPTLMKTGLSYRPGDRFSLNTEVQKAVDSGPRFSFGGEYRFLEQVAARMGFVTAPFSGHYGLGIYLGELNADYSFGNHSQLGDIHQISFTYRLTQ